ncbi:MAG TPA: hypothetical protein VFU30_14920 [Gaiellaceae bacterium]|nr:hypothetical protein [Gaiellaceae bacterium]
MFDLLGKSENDLTYSLGWGLAQSDSLVQHVLADVFPGEAAGDVQAVRLQEFIPGGGFTDIELETDRLAVILEAKVGWSLPGIKQLEKYAPRLHEAAIGRILVLSECTPEFAAPPRLPEEVAGIAVIYRSWPQIVRLVESCNPSGHAEKRVLRELGTYLRGLMTMQNHISNLVYVVALGRDVQPWSAPYTPIEIVVNKNLYFCPIGNGYPKQPPNYLGFRWAGKLQQVRHVDGYEVLAKAKDGIPELVSEEEGTRLWLFSLGEPIVPSNLVRTGNLFRAQRIEAAIDLLLTCETIREARDKTQERLAAAGEALS